MNTKTVSLSVILSALVLTLAVTAMIVTLLLQHARSRRPRLVSYPCIVVTGDKWVSRVELEMRHYNAWLEEDPLRLAQGVQR
jgi:hypothetical protein